MEGDDEAGGSASSNYNTITSLSALREAVGGDSSWFQHYVLNHMSRLPSRGGGPAARRLSECPEEDESQEEVAPPPPPPPPPLAAAQAPPSLGPSLYARPPSSRGPSPSPHFDKRFFDGSLIEMKSQASSTSTLDYDSTEEIWVRRPDFDTPKRKREVGAVGPASLPEGHEAMASGQDSSYRNRSDTWGTQTRQILARAEQDRRKHRGDQVYHTVTGAVSHSSKPQHVPSIFEVFRPRSKSDAATKKPTLIGHMKNAMQNSLKSQNSGEGGEHSHSSGRGPVAKVIHLFRHRSQSAVSAEEKRKAKAAALQQQQLAAHSTSGDAKSVLRRSSFEKRRLSLGTTSSSHRGSDPSLDPNHAAILFRDSRGLPVADPFVEKVSISDLEDESQIFVKFFKFHKSYDLIPTSAKLVVFDTQLLVKKAFFALIYNGVRAAPLWDSAEHRFVGMLTITDFIKILQMYYSSESMTMDQMEEQKLETWRSVLKDQAKELVSIGPDASLYEAIKTLIHNHIHRLPVIDPETGNVLYILTHKRILRFLFLYINDLPRPSFLNKSLAELRIGTFDSIETATEETTMITALDKFVERRVSALPIVDPEGRLIDIFAKFDVINLAADKTYNNLDMSLKQANEHRNEWFEGVHKCSMDDTLYSIIEKIVRAEVHRLVVTDDEDKVIGILSLSDLLQYLVLRPCGEEVVSRPVTPISELSPLQGPPSEETILEGEEDEVSSREMTPPPQEQEDDFPSSPPALQNDSWREVTVPGSD